MKQRITTSIVKRQAMGATQVSGLALMEMAQSLLGTKEKQTRNQGCGRSLLISWRSSDLSIVFGVFLRSIELEKIVFDVFFPSREKRMNVKNRCFDS